MQSRNSFYAENFTSRARVERENIDLKPIHRNAQFPQRRVSAHRRHNTICRQLASTQETRDSLLVGCKVQRITHGEAVEWRCPDVEQKPERTQRRSCTEVLLLRERRHKSRRN